MCKEFKLLYLLDTEILDTLEPDSYELPMIVYLITRQATKLNSRDSFMMEVRDLYEYLGDKDTKPNNTVVKKSIEALKLLESKGWITIRQMEKNLTFTSKIRVNAHPLLHVDGEKYVSFDSDVVRKIVACGLSNFSKLLMTYINVMSYIDWRDVEYLKSNEVDLGDIYKLTTDSEWHISCYAKLDTLALKRYNSDNNTESWVSIKSLSTYLHKLEELSLISIVTVKTQSTTMNHYCLPEHRELVEKIAKRKVSQIDWNVLKEDNAN